MSNIFYDRAIPIECVNKKKKLSRYNDKTKFRFFFFSLCGVITAES